MFITQVIILYSIQTSLKKWKKPKQKQNTIEFRKVEVWNGKKLASAYHNSLASEVLSILVIGTLFFFPYAQKWSWSNSTRLFHHVITSNFQWSTHNNHHNYVHLAMFDWLRYVSRFNFFVFVNFFLYFFCILSNKFKVGKKSPLFLFSPPDIVSL